jgi:hypothetical protein
LNELDKPRDLVIKLGFVHQLDVLEHRDRHLQRALTHMNLKVISHTWLRGVPNRRFVAVAVIERLSALVLWVCRIGGSIRGALPPEHVVDFIQCVLELLRV